MLTLISMLFRFITATIFKRGELDVTQSTFRPVKVLAVFAFLFLLFFTSYATYRLYHTFDKVEKICPGIIGSVKELPLHVLETGHYICPDQS